MYDFPYSNIRFSLQQCTVSPIYERELISQRTTDALNAKKARGAILGRPENLSLAAAAAGRALGRATRVTTANTFAAKVLPMIQEYQAEGMSLNTIAKRLTADSILIASGKSNWTATSVKNIIAR